MGNNIAAVINASEGVVNAASAAEVVADSGAITLTGGSLYVADLDVVISLETGSIATMEVDIQHRNAANDGTTQTIRVYLAPHTTVVIPFKVELATGERVRAIAVTAPGTGDDLSVLITGIVRSS